MLNKYRTWTLTSEMTKGSTKARITIAAGSPPSKHERVVVIDIEAYNELKREIEVLRRYGNKENTELADEVINMGVYNE